jgi:hypothetical protein
VQFTIVDNAFEGTNSFCLTVTEFNVGAFDIDRAFGSLQSKIIYLVIDLNNRIAVMASARAKISCGNPLA